jgi:hypothetical protein
MENWNRDGLNFVHVIACIMKCEFMRFFCTSLVPVGEYFFVYKQDMKRFKLIDLRNLKVDDKIKGVCLKGFSHIYISVELFVFIENQTFRVLNTNLRSLKLEFLEIPNDKAHIAHLSCLGLFSNLTSLSLCKFYLWDQSDFNNILNFPKHLQNLRLVICPAVTNDNVQIFITNNPQLKYFNFQFCKLLDSNFIKQFAAELFAEHLHRVNLCVSEADEAEETD